MTFISDQLQETQNHHHPANLPSLMNWGFKTGFIMVYHLRKSLIQPPGQASLPHQRDNSMRSLVKDLTDQAIQALLIGIAWRG